MAREIDERVLDAFAEAFALYVFTMETAREMPHQGGDRGIDLVYAEESDMYGALMTELERQEGISCIDPDRDNELCDYLHKSMYRAYDRLVQRERAA